MPQMFDLFITKSSEAGYRLSYMKIYNWGTFHGRVYRIAPNGNNSLLTGANASGKSTLIDALLTLMVPNKKDRFYNQSSGVEKKGDRTEETYVLGNYGNIQNEGESQTSTQRLRDKKTRSIILATFTNTNGKNITLFQVRWFSAEELKCQYGIAYKALTIEKDFANFDPKTWKKNLENKYNTPQKTFIYIGDNITNYRTKIIDSFGLRSDRALSLFNQLVGVKVLDNLDNFISNNMLEMKDAEEEYTKLSNHFAQLIEAKTNIEKVEEQISQLKEIDKLAQEIDKFNTDLATLEQINQAARYWFAQKNVALATEYLEKLNQQHEILIDKLEELNNQKEDLKDQEARFNTEIASDSVGNQIKNLEKEINQLENSKKRKQGKRNEYDKKINAVGINTPSDEKSFVQNREFAQQRRNELDRELNSINTDIVHKNDEIEKIDSNIKKLVDELKVLRDNKNNISGDVARIRNEIIAAVGADRDEIPFIGELIKVKDTEHDWQPAIEKILHNFALRLIVPEEYYNDVNEYVNGNDLRGRIVYHRYKSTSSLGKMRQDDSTKNLINKIEIKKCQYSDWVSENIRERYNYVCVDNLEEFNLYKQHAVTMEGLIKSGDGKHEKDDRPEVKKPSNYVLGWDNKQKMEQLRNEVRQLQVDSDTAKNAKKELEQQDKTAKENRETFASIFDKYDKYDEIDWQRDAAIIQEKNDQKKELEKTNDRVKTLQEQLQKVKEQLEKLENVEIENVKKKIWNLTEKSIPDCNNRIKINQQTLDSIEYVDTQDFERENPKLSSCNINDIDNMSRDFSYNNEKNKEEKRSQIENIKNSLRDLMLKFTHPDEQITEKFRDWRSDVQQLTTDVDFVSQYQEMYHKLEDEELVNYKKKFEEFLTESISTNVSGFSNFFSSWKKSIEDTIKNLNNSLKSIEYKEKPSTYIQLDLNMRNNEQIKEFRKLLENALIKHELNSTIDGKRIHFEQNIMPLFNKLKQESYRKSVMDVRNWFVYKASEYYKETGTQYKTYQNMGELSGGEKAQLTYTILGSAIAHQFGITKSGLDSESLRFIAIDEAFKAQDSEKARYLITLCKQLNLQLLVVTPSDNINIVENDISYVHYVERVGNESHVYDMPIEQFREQRQKYLNQ